MAHTVISAKYPPHIDPTRTPIAYGDRALPRLVCINSTIIKLETYVSKNFMVWISVNYIRNCTETINFVIAAECVNWIIS